MNARTEIARIAARRATPAEPVTARAGMLGTLLFAAAVIAAVLFGWSRRGEYYLSAEYGLGYALGIAGGSMMLLLLLYPLRKRLRVMQRWLPLRSWFQLHMVLGVVGPLCILYHCNFHLGAPNSNIALLCMGLMVASGLVGRFIYARIYHGLYGQKASLAELQQRLAAWELQLQGNIQQLLDDDSLRRLHAIEREALRPLGTAGNLWRSLGMGMKTRALYRRIRRRVNAREAAGRTLLRHVDVYLDTVRRIAGFSFYERLFSLWHVLHMPIFFMLVITGLIHVYAVHRY